MIRAFLFFVFTAIVFPLTAQVFPNPATLSTGQGAIGSFDPIWTVTDFYPTLPPNPIGLTFTPALINNNCAPGAWVDPATLPPPVNNGNWITNPNLPCANNYNDGYLYFRLTLNLPSDCNGSFVTTPGAYTLYFDGYVDNAITDVFINGNSTGLSGGGFSPGSQLSITLPGPWVAGLNYVDILVYNANNGGQLNPYGLLLVANSNASATIDTDNDGLPDINDVCPCMAGTLPNGCPFPITGDTIICFGESTTLRTPYAGTYQWSTSATIDSIVVSPATNTSYSLTVTEPNGTVHTDAVTVIVHQLPTPTITPATADICQGENFGLTASGGQQYQWSTTDVTNTITVSPATNTTYTVTATDANGCTATANSAVTVHLPAAITVYDTICNGSTYTLPDGIVVSITGTYNSTVPGPVCDTSYTTHLTVNPTHQTPVSATICDNQTHTLPGGGVVSMPGVYRDTLPNRYGCDSIVITSLTVNPTYNNTINAQICSNQTYQLPDGTVVSTAGTYTTPLTSSLGCDSVIVTNLTIWPVQTTPVSAAICDNQTYTRPSGAVVNTAGVYNDTLVATTTGCDSIVVTTLTVNPTYRDTLVTGICQGNSYQLPDGSIVSTAGTYTSALQTVAGCDSVWVTQLSVWPVYANTLQATICDNQTYTLPGGNSVATAGTYRDTLLTVNGCDSIIITNLTVHPTFRDSSYVTICSDQTHQLPDGSTVNTAGIYTTTLATAQGCDSVWVTQVSVLPVTYGTLYDTICTGQTYTFPSGTTVTQAGTYSDTLRRNASCDSIITIHLAVMEIGFNLTAVDVPCHGEATGSLSANITAGLQPLAYQWSDPSWSGPQITSIAAGTYSLTLTDAFGCTATQTATVAEPLPLTATVQALDVSCHGMGDGQITVVASGGTQPLSITIDTFQSGSGNLSNLGAGIYPISLVDANGCNVLDTATILEPDSFVLLTQPDSLWVDLGDTLTLSLTSNHDPATTYQWQPFAGLSCLDCPDPNVLLYDTDTLVLTTSYPAPYRTGECVQEHPITINVRELKNLFVPTAFSPNADGQNDYYRVFGNLKGLRIFTMRIFDRSGELIFESNNPHFAWDGTFNGTLVGPGVFIYEVRYAWYSSWETMNTERGSLTILR